MPSPPGLLPAALRWSAATLRANLLAFVLLAAVVTIIGFLQVAAAGPLNASIASCLAVTDTSEQLACLQNGIGLALPAVGVSLLAVVLQFLASIGVFRAGLAATRGTPPDFAMMLSGVHLLRYILVTLASAALVAVGLLLCIVPGLLALFWLQLAPFYALDRGAGVRESIAGSFRAVSRNVPACLALLGITVLSTLIGGLFLGLPTLLTLPFTALLTAFLYRVFNGEAVR